MIIKISKGNGQWVWVDGVKSVEYSSVAHSAVSRDQLEKQVSTIKDKANGCPVRDALMEIDWSGSGRRFDSKRPYRFGTMIVELHDLTKELVLFDHPAYFCDDSGNTVEKISVR